MIASGQGQFSLKMLLGNILAIAIISGCIAMSIVAEKLWLPVAVVAGLCFVALCCYNPRIWLYGVVLSYYGFVDISGVGLSLIDVVFAFFLIVTLFLWYGWMFFVAKRKIFYHWIDKLLLLYTLVTLAINLFVAYDHGTTPLNWLREWVIGIMIMYYIPLREYFSEKKHFRTLMIVFGVLVVAFVYTNLINYYKLANASEFAYQISGIRKGTTFIALGVIFAVAISVKNRLWKIRLPVMMFAFLSIAGLVATYVRAYWLACLVMLAVMFIFFNNKERLRSIVMFGVVSVVGLFVINTVFGRISTIVTKVIASRFSSSLKGKKDLSLLARVYESKAVLGVIEAEPITGIGLGTNYYHWDPISQKGLHYNFVHNGYLGYIMKNGLLIGLLFFGIHLRFSLHALKVVRQCIRSQLSDNDKAIAIASFCGLLMLFVVSLTSAIFYDRAVGLSFALNIAGICLTEKKLREQAQRG